MRIAIMQPYFFPYIGYFQLINTVDEFVVYDNIEFTKKGWINRNRILVNGKDSYITIPLKKDSDYLNIRDRYVAESWLSGRMKLLNRISCAYKKAPFFESVYPVVEKCILADETNLFELIFNSIVQIKNYLRIQTELLISSSIPIDHELKAVKKVIGICNNRKASIYVNPIGGVELYDRDTFRQQGVTLCFLKSEAIKYIQLRNDFVPNLSIIDVLMFNSKDAIAEMLHQFSLE